MGGQADIESAMTTGAVSGEPMPRAGDGSDTSPDLRDEHRVDVYRFLLGLTRDHGEAEDLAQESLLQAWRKRHLYQQRGSFVGFLRRTAFHLWLNHVKKKGRRRKLAPVDSAPESDLPSSPGDPVARADALSFFVLRMTEALDELPPDQRDAFVDFHFEAMTCMEIAERTGTPVKTVETRVRRATLALAHRLRHHRSLLSGRERK
jgi:RNA polymerase sigma-70 factor (ECF subfamily)